MSFEDLLKLVVRNKFGCFSKKEHRNATAIGWLVVVWVFCQFSLIPILGIWWVLGLLVFWRPRIVVGGTADCHMIIGVGMLTAWRYMIHLNRSDNVLLCFSLFPRNLEPHD